MSDVKNAVVQYTKSELSKVDNNLLNQSQLNFLLQKTNTKHIKERPAKGGGVWQYVKGSFVKKTLNFMFGWRWSFTILDTNFMLNAEQVIVHGKLTIKIKNDDGTFEEIIKEQFGKADIKFKSNYVKQGNKNVKVRAKNADGSFQPLDLGNDCKAAATDALKKCATELGLFSDVYAPEDYIEVKVVDDVPEVDDSEVLRELVIEITEDLERVKDSKQVDGFRDMLLKKQSLKELTVELATNIRDEIKTIIDEQ